MAEAKTEVTTLADLETTVDHYEALRATIEALKGEQDKEREKIIQGLRDAGVDFFNDSKGRRIRVSTTVRKYINYSEAEAMLEADVLAKLTKETESTVLTVRVAAEKATRR